MSELDLRACTYFSGKFTVVDLANRLTTSCTLGIGSTKNPGDILNMMLHMICSRITEKLGCCQHLNKTAPIHALLIHLTSLDDEQAS